MIVKLIQRANEINLENADTIKSFEITYSGSFVVEVIGNAKVRLTRNIIFIDYIESPNDMFMIYEGNLRMRQITAYNIEGEKVDVWKSIKSDEWKRVKLKLSNKAKIKWTEYNKTIKYPRSVKTMVAYTINGSRRAINSKGSSKVNHKGMEIKKLNRIRGKYGIK